MRVSCHSACRHLALANLLLLGLHSSGFAQHTEPAWTYNGTGRISRFAVAATGHLLVADSAGVRALDPASGEVRWHRPDAIALHTLGAVDLVILETREHWEITEMATGIARWTSHDLPLQRTWRWRSMPDLGLLIVIGAVPEVPYRTLGVSLETGDLLWVQDTLFSRVNKLEDRARELDLGGDQPILRARDNTIVVHPEVGGMMRLQLDTGELLWRADSLDERPLPYQRGYAAFAVDSTAVYVPRDKRVLALDVNTGRRLWERTEDYPSHPATLLRVRQGLLVYGYHRDAHPGRVRVFLDLVDPATGTSRWAQPLRDLDDASVFMVEGDSVLLASKHSLMTVDLASSRVREVRPLHWQGDEIPVRMERRDSNVVIWSSQNLAGTDSAGRPFERFYKAPGEPGLLKLLTNAVNLAMYAAAPPGTLVSQASTSGRYRATVTARRYVHILTEAPDSAGHKGFSFIRLDKDTGAESGRVWVDRRNPEFALDAATGSLYLLVGKSTINALRF